MSDRGRGRGGYRGRGDSPSPGGRGGFRGGQGQRGGGPPPHARGRGDFPGGRGGGGGGYGRGGPSRGRGGPPPKAIFREGVPAQIDSRLADSDINALVNRFKKLKVSNEDRVVRPDFGKRGSAVTLRANYFAIKYPKNIVLYDYPILIEPSVKEEEKRTRRRLFELLEKSPEVEKFKNEIAHDSVQRLISKRPLPANFRAEIKFYEAHQTEPGPKSKEYTITLGDVRELKSKDLDGYLQGENADYDPLPIIAAFNLITTAYAMRTGVRFGRNRYYWDPQSYGEYSMPLGPGLEIWKGFVASVRPTYKSLMINVNVAMSPFFTPFAKLSDAMRQFSNATKGARLPENFYRRVRVTTNYLGYKKKSTIFGFSDTSSKKTKFKCEEYGGEISVEEYFKRKYKIALHDADLQLVNLGNKNKNVWVPAELCELEPGQPHAGALVEKETAAMIKYACKPPYENARLITEQGLEKLGLIVQASPMKAFNVEVSLEMAVVPGRVLSAPKVQYHEKSQTVQNGSWNILKVKFYRGAALSKLAVLVVADGDAENDFESRDDPALIAIIDGFVAKCRSSGMTVGNPVQREFVNIAQMWRLPRQPALEAIEKTLGTLSHPSMLLVLLSNRNQHIFSGIKKLLDCKLGIPNVCMLTAKVRRGQDQYYSNIALKVNAKLGGINHQIDPTATSWLKDTMLVGMDVTHPGVNCVKGTPSIAAVVASCDATFIQYPASLRLHEYRVEMIEFVKEMMIERLQEYQRRMNGLPSRIVVFRDGVSEGQFNIVLENELPKVQEAFKHFRDYKPKLTIAICGKRHHTRFYPTKNDEADDRTSNTKAGTVVDRGVTAVYDFDFYLQAHSALQGTVRPTHYTVIYDENRFQADVIQQGTHDISYLWARATKSVSYAPPAYWADRACDRARLYLHEVLPPDPKSKVRKFPEDKMRQHAEGIWGNGIHENLRGTMFYL